LCVKLEINQGAVKDVQKNQSKNNDMIQSVDIAKGTFLQMADEAKHSKMKLGTLHARSQHTASSITRCNSQSSFYCRTVHVATLVIQSNSSTIHTLTL